MCWSWDFCDKRPRVSSLMSLFAPLSSVLREEIRALQGPSWSSEDWQAIEYGNWHSCAFGCPAPYPLVHWNECWDTFLLQVHTSQLPKYPLIKQKEQEHFLAFGSFATEGVSQVRALARTIRQALRMASCKIKDDAGFLPRTPSGVNRNRWPQLIKTIVSFI